MSSVKILVQNDNDKDVTKDDISKQTSLDTTIDMYADENEEKDVRGSVLHTEEKHKARRGQSKADIKDGLIQNFSIHGTKFTVAYNQPPAGPGGWFSQGPPPQPQQGWAQQGQPPQQQGWFQQGQPPQQQGWVQQGQPPQQQGWFQQGPPPQQESDDQSNSPFDYRESEGDRNAFVRKVMLILMVMLLVTSIFMVVALSVKSVRMIFQRYCFFIALPCLIILIVMSCFMPTLKCARIPPTNYICLAIVTLLESLVCCAITSRYRTIIILEAFLTTLIVVIFCVCLACTNFDFTKFILIVLCVSMALVVLSVVVMIAHFAFGFKSKPLMIALLVCFTIVNVVMLIIELQMVLGGKSVELGEEDYALGAYMLYTSIVTIFLDLIFLAIGLDRFSFTNTGGSVLVKPVKADPQKDLK